MSRNDAKKTKTLMERSGKLIRCPKCNKVFQRSISTDSEFFCDCGFNHYHFYEGDVTIEFPSAYLQDEEDYEAARSAILTLRNLRRKYNSIG
ncbi:hypothetical protein ACTQ4F_02805 [Streptococcus alactolyticus]|uniref:hypothetical protein n=1 Tax=Streptococcus alactolyticus TaxID=29389 RepID=UPI003F972BD8